VSWSFSDWRRSRILRRVRIDEVLWKRVCARYSFLAGLNQEETARLKERVALFFNDKQIHGAGDLVLDEEMKLAIAVQACFIALNLPDAWYSGWVEVIVYPDAFVSQGEWQDEFGVVHAGHAAQMGEAWLRGPVILSWADVAQAGEDGVNVVIHEFAHKLDMLNGDVNGYPPLHAGMDRGRWSRVFSAAYADFCSKVSRAEPTSIDPYAAESPGEFFAVVSEAFFELPESVRGAYPEVYDQLVAFYRQDPHARQVAAALLQAVG
jgi:Mlc titration factor MtfA (ptsG expression regulator)